MNGAAPETPAWSRGRWWFMVVFIFAVQLACVLVLGARQTPVPRSAPPKAWLTMATTTTEQNLSDDFSLADPTLFALLNPRGFSGQAWLKVAPLEHELAEWSEPPQWLSPRVEQLTATFHQYVATNAVVPFELVNFPPPEASLRVAPDQPLLTRSVLRVEGDLRQRPLVETPKLPSIELADVLPDSEVEVLVNRDGHVVSARLSGIAFATVPGQQQADQNALAVARRLQFATDSSATGLARGLVVIHWHTVPPRETTAPKL